MFLVIHLKCGFHFYKSSDRILVFFFFFCLLGSKFYQHGIKNFPRKNSKTRVKTLSLSTKLYRCYISKIFGIDYFFELKLFDDVRLLKNFQLFSILVVFKCINLLWYCILEFINDTRMTNVIKLLYSEQGVTQRQLFQFLFHPLSVSLILVNKFFHQLHKFFKIRVNLLNF